MEIPQGINVRVEGHIVTVKGPQGEEVKAGDRALRGTLESVLKGMVHGASSGYSHNLKLLYAHFPITIEVKGKDISVKNFLGEKQPRMTVLVGSTKVTSKGQSVTVSGPDKEAVGQTIANLRSAMRIKDKDGRVFQDGIYEVEE
jgi:large subunit ribosomal protein L6